MGLDIGKRIKNKIMQNKTVQNMVHIKSSKTKKEHNVKRNSLFSKIRSKVRDWKKKTLPKDIGEAIADIIEPITNNIECLEGIKTEADFKKEFFRSLCGDKLPQSETDPAAFFARHPELSIRKEALQDINIKDMAELLTNVTEISTAFKDKFPKTVQDSAGKDIPQGERLISYITEINNAIKESNDEKVKFVPTKETSPQTKAMYKKLQKIKEDTQKAVLCVDIVERKFDKLAFDANRLKTIEQKIEAQKTSLAAVSASAIEKLNNIIDTLPESAAFIKESSEKAITDISNLHKTIHEILKEAEKDFKSSIKKCDTFIASKDYQKNTQSTKDSIPKHIASLEKLKKRYVDELVLATTAKDSAKSRFDEAPTDKKAKIRYEKATEDYTKINAYKTDIDTRLQALRDRQKEFQTLSKGEELKQYIIVESGKLVDMFDVPKDRTKIRSLINDFRINLDTELKNIPDIEKKQALQDMVESLEDVLPPLKLVSLFSALSVYRDPTDPTRNINLTFKNKDLRNLLNQRFHFQVHLDANTPHTINLNTPPNNLIDGRPVTLFASGATERKAINITKTGTDITITAHDFYDVSKNAQTYTLHASQIGDAQTYLNEILKSEKTTYPNFSDIGRTLGTFTVDKTIAAAPPPPPPPPPPSILDHAKVAPLLQDYWTLGDLQKTLKGIDFNALFPKTMKESDKKAQIDTYMKTLSPANQIIVYDILKDDKMTNEIEQRKALQGILTKDMALGTSKIEFNKIKKLPAAWRRISPNNGCKPLLFASDATGQHLKINISRGESHYYITYKSFPDNTKTPEQQIRIDASQVIQVRNAENYINELYTNEDKKVDLNEVKNKIQSFSNYLTPTDAKNLSQTNIDKIHHALYEKDNIIESHWTISDDPNDLGRKEINKKFDDLFPTKEIYDEFYTKVQKDGQPLTTLALKYLAHSKWREEAFHPEDEESVALLHNGKRKLLDVNNHNGENNIKWNNIFQNNGDAILLDFNNNPNAKSASDAHYTGALIQKTGDNDYKITTINTLREQDNQYILTGRPDIETIMNQIYGKSTTAKNLEGNLKLKQITDIKTILSNNEGSKAKIPEIEKILKGLQPKTKFKEIETILDKTMSEEEIQKIKYILENTIPQTNITSIEKNLTDLGIESTPTGEHPRQTGLRCGITMVDRAIDFLKETKEEINTKAEAKEKEIPEGTSDQEIIEILSSTYNDALQRKVSDKGNNIIVPQNFILNRYISRNPHIVDPLHPTKEEQDLIRSIEDRLKASTTNITKTFNLNTPQKRRLFANDRAYMDAYIDSYEKTDPITAIALLDYQYPEYYEPLTQSMQEGRKYQSILSSASTTEDQKNPFISKPTSFLFKTDANNHTIVTIIPKPDNTHQISFVNSQNNQQHIFTIYEGDENKDIIKNDINGLVEYCSEKLIFEQNNSATYSPNRTQTVMKGTSDILINLQNQLVPLAHNNLDNNVPYLEHVNSFIKDPILYPIHERIKGKQYAEAFTECWDTITTSIENRDDVKNILNAINEIGKGIWGDPEKCINYQEKYSLEDPKHHIIASLYAQERDKIPEEMQYFIALRDQTEKEHAKGVEFSADLFHAGNDYSAVFITKSQSDNPACPFAPILITKNLNDTYDILLREYDRCFEHKNIPQEDIKALYDSAKNEDIILGNKDEAIPKSLNNADTKLEYTESPYDISTEMFDDIIKIELNYAINKRVQDTINNIKEAIDQGKEFNVDPNIINSFFNNPNNYLAPDYILPIHLKMLEQEDVQDMDKIQLLETIMQNRERTKTIATLDELLAVTEDNPNPYGIFFIGTIDDNTKQSLFESHRIQKNAATDNYTVTFSHMGYCSMEFTIPSANIADIYNSLKSHDIYKEILRDITAPPLKNPLSLLLKTPDIITSENSLDTIYDLILSLANPLPPEDEVPEPDAKKNDDPIKDIHTKMNSGEYKEGFIKLWNNIIGSKASMDDIDAFCKEIYEDREIWEEYQKSRPNNSKEHIIASLYTGEILLEDITEKKPLGNIVKDVIKPFIETSLDAILETITDDTLTFIDQSILEDKYKGDLLFKEAIDNNFVTQESIEAFKTIFPNKNTINKYEKYIDKTEHGMIISMYQKLLYPTNNKERRLYDAMESKYIKSLILARNKTKEYFNDNAIKRDYFKDNNEVIFFLPYSNTRTTSNAFPFKPIAIQKMPDNNYIMTLYDEDGKHTWTIEADKATDIQEYCQTLWDKEGEPNPQNEQSLKDMIANNDRQYGDNTEESITAKKALALVDNIAAMLFAPKT